MTNAFVAALLSTAAEHRLKAESLRNLYAEEQPVGDWAPAPFRRFAEWLRADTFKRADEQDSLAETYEKFAHQIISEVSGQLILEQMQKLSGHAHLFEIEPEPAFRVWGGDSLMSLRYWYPDIIGPPGDFLTGGIN